MASTGDALARVREAYLQKRCTDGEDPKEEAKQFEHLVQIVKGTFSGRLPFSNVDDPGAHYEYNLYLKQCDKKARKVLEEALRISGLNTSFSPDDLRCLRSQEELRELYWRACSPARGFQALGRPPELQQLIASCCMDVFAMSACKGIHGETPQCELIRGLVPHLQVNLLAEVAAGILCPR